MNQQGCLYIFELYSDTITDKMLKFTVLYPRSLYFPSHEALGAGGSEILGTRLGNVSESIIDFVKRETKLPMITIQ